MSYDRTNRGAAWKAERKSDKHPAYKGTLNVNGSDFELAIWKGDGDGSGKGKPDITLTVKPKEAAQAASNAKAQADALFVGDDIPF